MINPKNNHARCLIFIFLLWLSPLLSQATHHNQAGIYTNLTQFDLKILSSHYENLLLSKYTYTPDLKVGDIVRYDAKDFKVHNGVPVQQKKTSYLFFVFQLMATSFFVGLIIRDFFNMLEIGASWSVTLNNNFYLFTISLLKLTGLTTIALDIPLAFSSLKPKPKPTLKPKTFKKFNDQGWQVLRIIVDDNFDYKSHVSVLYINKKKTKMILAIQGTNSWRDWYDTNWTAVRSQQPLGQTLLSFQINEVCVQELKKHGISCLTFTGHSLGGFLSQVCMLMAIMHFGQDDIHFRAVTFDAPGARDLLNNINFNTENHQINLSNLDMTNYVSTPNLINSYYDHSGSIKMISNHLDIEPDRAAKFLVTTLKLIFYTTIPMFLQYLLLFAKNLFTKNTFQVPYISRKVLYFTTPILTLFIAIPLIYQFEVNFLRMVKNLSFSYYHHSLINFINASDDQMGTINASEVSYFPKYREEEPIAKFFSKIVEGKAKYAKNILVGALGVCYVKSKNNNFLPIRHVLPNVCSFLQNLDKRYPEPHVKNTLLRLLGAPIQYVYNNQGILQGIRSTNPHVNILLAMDHLASLLEEKDQKNNKNPAKPHLKHLV